MTRDARVNGDGEVGTQFGYTLSSEEFAPTDLVTSAERAESLGFDFCSISDHFHPWVSEQGHSPFVWSVLGAIAARTDLLHVGVGVTCPILRVHPAVIAHAAATTSLLFEGRFFLGVGSGEALNEHIIGERWPPPNVRLAMLEEAIGIIRDLWTGETVDHRGEFYEIDNARLFDPPDPDLPLLVSGYGERSAQLAARVGDGLWGVSPAPEPVKAFHAAGGFGPRIGQLAVCFGPDEETCRQTVHRVWPNGGVPGQLSQDLPTFTHFEQIASTLSIDQTVGEVPCGPDVGRILDSVQQYVDAGYDHIYFHQIGPDQDAFLELWERELQDGVRAGRRIDLTTTLAR